MRAVAVQSAPKPFRLTELNRHVNALYARCKADGGCIPSSVYVTRSFPLGLVDLPTCVRCGVPQRGGGGVAQLSLKPGKVA